MQYDMSAASLADEAVEQARVAGDRRTEGRALYLAAWLKHLFASHDDGVRLIEESVAITREQRDRWGLAMALLQLGIAHGSRPHLAAGPLEEAAAVCEELGDRYILNTVRYNLSRTLITTGRTSEGEAMIREVVDHARRVGDTFSLTMAVAELGVILSVRGQFDEAIEMLEDNVELFDRGRLPWASQEVQARGVLGSVLRSAGRAAEAREPVERSLALSRELGMFPDIMAMSLANLALVEADLGNDEAIPALVGEALSIADGVGESWPAAVTRATAGFLAWRRGDSLEADRLGHAALSMSHELGYIYWPHGAIDCLELLALNSEDGEQAARLFGSVDAAFQRAGRVREPSRDRSYTSAVEHLRQELGDDAFDRAHAEGAALSLDEAVEYARRGRGRRKRPSTGWGSLTPTELEVVKLVAEGLSNPQIADRMFISRKTVTTHLTHVFAKLGLRSRAALSAEVVRRETGAS